MSIKVACVHHLKLLLPKSAKRNWSLSPFSPVLVAKEVNQVATQLFPQPHSYSLLCYFSVLLGAPSPPPPAPPTPPISSEIHPFRISYYLFLRKFRERLCIFLHIFTPWLFTGRKISFSSENHSDLKLRLVPITWFAIWLGPIVYACPLWLADLSSRLYKWHLFYAFSSWREKECRWNLLPNIRMFRWAIQ